MRRRFVTQHDIDDLVAAGTTELVVDDATTLTDLARERAHDRGVRLVKAPAGSAAPARAPMAAPTAGGTVPPPAPAAATAAPGTADPALPAVPAEHRARVRAAVRAAVIAELGGEPAELDEVLDRVLNA